MRQLIAAALMIVAAILAWPFTDVTAPMRPQPKTIERAPESYLGREYLNLDNWQAQSQKKEGTLLCPPFCVEIVATDARQMRHWRRE